MRDAASVHGVASVTFLESWTGSLSDAQGQRKVTREVRRLRPDVIVAPDPSASGRGTGYVNHSDRKAAGMLALSAVMPDAPTRVMFQEARGGGPRAVRGPHALPLPVEDPDTFVDAHRRDPRRWRGRLRAHVSQLSPEVDESG